ncbi:MAG: hypothetical protein M3O22_01035 [Pseudomonadota bacterium]|nr:hypothetical protein [Pseudomonadota bacterium]
MARKAWLLVLLVLAAPLAPAWGQQGLLSGTGSTDDKTPVEVQADEALEWHRDDKVYIAKGNASAKRGDMTLLADILTAHYRDGANGGTQIWKLTASGNVRIITPTQKAFGDEAVYDVDPQAAVLTGKNLKLETPQDTVTAQDSLEYWSLDKKAVAKGNAVATRGQNRLRGDVLEARFQENAQGNLDLKTIDAVGDVTIVTPSDVLRGQKGTYNVLAQTAVIDGDVRITRGDNQLNGDRAEVNLATGISRMLSSGPTPGKTGGRVKGLFVPNKPPDIKTQNGTPKQQGKKPSRGN